MTASPPRICVIDDDPAQREQIVKMLREVLQAYTGSEAAVRSSKIESYGSALDILPKITDWKPGQPFDWDVIVADVYMPFEPGGRYPHSQGGAIRIYEAIKAAGLQDHVYLIIISKEPDGAEFEIADIRKEQEQDGLDRQWARVVWKPKDMIAKDAGVVGVSRDTWKAVVERAIARRGERTPPPAGLLKQGFFTNVTATVEELSQRSRAPYLLVNGGPGTPKEEVARYFTSQLGLPVGHETLIVLQTNNAKAMASGLFGQELPPPPRLGLFEQHEDSLVMLDSFAAEDPDRRHLDAPILSLLRSMPKKQREGAAEFCRIEGIQPIKFKGTIVFFGNSLAELTRNASIDPALLSLLERRRVDIPALREHRDKVVSLAKFLLAQAAPDKEFDGSAMQVLRGAEWHNNVRELQDVIAAVAHQPGRWVGADALWRLGVANARLDPPTHGLGLWLRDRWRRFRWTKRLSIAVVIAGLGSFLIYVSATVQGFKALSDMGCQWGWLRAGCAAPASPIAPPASTSTGAAAWSPARGEPVSKTAPGVPAAPPASPLTGAPASVPTRSPAPPPESGSTKPEAK